MTSIKTLSAALLIAAGSIVASNAFAGTDDGNVAPYQAFQNPTVAAKQAPAPTAAAASTRQADVKADKNDFTEQLNASSGN